MVGGFGHHGVYAARDEALARLFGREVEARIGLAADLRERDDRDFLCTGRGGGGAGAGAATARGHGFGRARGVGVEARPIA